MKTLLFKQPDQQMHSYDRLSGTVRVFALYIIFPDRRKQLRVASNAGTCILMKTLLFKQSDQQMHSYDRSVSGTVRVFALYIIFPDKRKQLRVASNAGTCTLMKTLLFKQSDQQMHSYDRG